jgi:uncharacterized protein YndB with AHSA1/START domain
MTTIAHELNVRATTTAAFEALSTPAGIRGWWSKDSDISEAVEGEHEMRFDKGGNTVLMKFRVDALDVGELVRWTCTENGNPVWKGTTLTWKISAANDGCRVAFAHEGFAEDQSPPYKMTVQGWNHIVNSLRSYLEGGQGQPW